MVRTPPHSPHDGASEPNAEKRARPAMWKPGKSLKKE